ncbi:MAG: EamA family transporter [Angelakisella sp.]|nr:EamA family transporter [Angelakisella sp.]
MKAKGIFFTVLSALLFGVCPVLSSKTYQMGSNPLTLTFYREAMVLPLLLVTLLARRISLRVTWRELLALSLVGVLCRGATTLMLNVAYNYVGVGTATTLHFMYPVFVALLCRGLFRERLGRAKVLALVLASAGVVLFLERGGGSNALLGMALALCSGVTYAAFMVAVGKTSLSRMDPFLVTFYSAAAVAAGVLLADIPLGQLVFRLPPKAFFYTFLIAVGSSYAAVILLQIGVRYLSATTAAVFSLFEPVSCSIAGAVWLGETFTLQKLLGSVIILGAAGLLAAAKPEVSPDSQEALALLMSPEGFPHPPESPEEETAAEK